MTTASPAWRVHAILATMLARKDIPAEPMTVDEFFRWAASRPREEGRFELHDGRIVATAPERMAHVIVKFSVAMALRNAIRAAGLPCRAFTEGLGVRMFETQLYIPDVLLACGSMPVDLGQLEIAPVAVFEVASPSTEDYDETSKLTDYLNHPSIMHAVFVSPMSRRTVHHRRTAPGRADTRVLNVGDTLVLDPPGIEVPVASFFEDLE